jgi:GAF domain-containing protein
LSAKEAISKSLAVLGRMAKADRVWIARYNHDLTRFWNTHEWTNRGFQAHVMDLQGASSQMMSWGHQRMLKGEVMEVPDVENMPRSARSLRAELRRQKIGSTVVFPLYHKKKLLGFYGFDFAKPVDGWSAESMQFRKKVAVHLAGLVAKESLSFPPASKDSEVAPKVIYVKSDKARVSIAEDEILMLRSYGDYTWIHLTNGKRYMELRSLKSWSTLLSRDEFIRVHQRFAVRANRIIGVEKASSGGWSLALKGWAERIPVGRTYRHLIRSKMGF